MRSFQYLITSLILILMSFPAWAEEISIHGSTRVFKKVFKKNGTSIEKKTGITLKFVANGSGKGILDLVDGKANMAMISVPLDYAIARVNQKYPGKITENSLVGRQVGQTRIAFIVHESNPVKKLSLDQVKRILQGRISNWAEVGGPDKPIVVVSENSNGDTRTLVENKVLNGGMISAPGKIEVTSGNKVAKLASKFPLIFGVSSTASIDSAVKTVKTEKTISQPLILVTKGSSKLKINKVIAITTRFAPK